MSLQFTEIYAHIRSMQDMSTNPQTFIYHFQTCKSLSPRLLRTEEQHFRVGMGNEMYSSHRRYEKQKVKPERYNSFTQTISAGLLLQSLCDCPNCHRRALTYMKWPFENLFSVYLSGTF